LKNEIGHNDFNHASVGLLSGKRFFVSNEQVSLQGIDLRLPTTAYTAHSLLVALQYGVYRFTSNDLFFMRLKKNKKILFLNRNDNAYSFAHEGQNLKKINNLKPLYYTFLLGFFCCFSLSIIALLIKTQII
jgi:hypothetical protein